MVSTWWRSETFSHGLLVLPAFLWLVWRNRAALSVCDYSFDFAPLLLCLGAGLLWLLSSVAGILVGEQVALTTLLILVIWSAIGRRAAQLIAFPLAFLFFLAPVGEEFVPQLMAITAELTTFAISLTGIPIYQEGLYFSLPSGDWSVVEACSGIRYLIASVALGSLYAYLTYRSAYRRAAFIFLAAVVPIIANAIRAFGIVMIGHFSGMRLATGVDHLVYGWLFFGIVMFALFTLGALFQESDTAIADSPANATAAEEPGQNAQLIGSQVSTEQSGRRVNYKHMFTYGGLFCFCVLLWPAWNNAIQRSVGQTVSDEHKEFALLQSDDVSVDSTDTEHPVTDWRPEISGYDAAPEATIKISNDLTGDISNIRALAFVFREQRQGKEMINSMNRLVTSKDPIWRKSSTELVTLGMPALNTVEQSKLISKNQSLQVWHWYQVGDVHTANAMHAKILETRNRLLLQKSESIAWYLIAELSRDDVQESLKESAEKILSTR